MSVINTYEGTKGVTFIYYSINNENSSYHSFRIFFFLFFVQVFGFHRFAFTSVLLHIFGKIDFVLFLLFVLLVMSKNSVKVFNKILCKSSLLSEIDVPKKDFILEISSALTYNARRNQFTEITPFFHSWWPSSLHTFLLYIFLVGRIKATTYV